MLLGNDSHFKEIKVNPDNLISSATTIFHCIIQVIVDLVDELIHALAIVVPQTG